MAYCLAITFMKPIFRVVLGPGVPSDPVHELLPGRHTAFFVEELLDKVIAS